MGNNMRVTGMISGLDTESIISQLVEARSTKVTDLKGEQTKLEWKQEIWKDLNSKIKNLVNNTLSNLRYSSAYRKKTTEASNSDKVSITTDETAMNTTQSLKINKLATSGYMTGGKLAAKVTSGSKVTEALGIEVGSNFSVTVGEGENAKTKEIEIKEGTTISGLVSQLQAAGVDANFDASNQRIYIGAKESGKAADFKLSASTSEGKETLSKLGLSDDKAVKVKGEDSEIVLNDAVYTSSSNTVSVNGLTLNLKAVTLGEETISLTTKQDNSAIYDTIKSFVKEYSELINKMDKLYNADSAKKYKVLTDEEKEAMTDDEVEKWETTIKDSLLRRDSTISTAASAMKSIMAASYTVNGKAMSLSDFGIGTLSYFTAADNEKNAYHINGDSDDNDVKNETNTLMKMIEEDPDSVVDFFTKLTNELYQKLNSMMGTSSYSSFGSIYDDKKMKSDYDDYTSKIATAEEKLNDYEDKWYKKFSAMETAMAKMQNNSSAITNMLGGSQ